MKLPFIVTGGCMKCNQLLIGAFSAYI